MQNYFVYILLCADDTYYVGQTNDLNQRIDEHNTKKFIGYTSSRLPVKVVYSMSFTTRAEALLTEKRLKTWSRTKKEALIQGKFSLSS